MYGEKSYVVFRTFVGMDPKTNMLLKKLFDPAGTTKPANFLQILFSVRSERKQMACNMMVHWFVGLGIDGPV